MKKAFILLGIIFIIIGISWPYIKKLPIGRLPGDIIIQKENFTFYFPITTCILIGIILGIIFWFIRK